MNLNVSRDRLSLAKLCFIVVVVCAIASFFLAWCGWIVVVFGIALLWLLKVPHMMVYAFSYPKTKSE